MEEGIEAFVARWEAEPVLAGEAALPAEARERQRAIRRANTPRGLAACLVYGGQGAMEPLHDRLADVAAPTLVIVGADDPARARARGGRCRRSPARAWPSSRGPATPRTSSAPTASMPSSSSFLTESAA